MCVRVGDICMCVLGLVCGGVCGGVSVYACVRVGVMCVYVRVCMCI